MADTRVFYYETNVDWQTAREGRLTGSHLPDVEIGAPPEFKGREGVWTPEHLFVGSVAACFMLTLIAVAENSGLPLAGFSMAARGKLERVPGSPYRITEIVLKPTVVVGTGGDLERVPRILEKAKENCFVANSIQTAVRIEPEIYHQKAPTVPCPPEQV